MITQESIDHAFSNHPRVSNRKYRRSDQENEVEYVILNGKNTRNRGVQLMKHPTSGKIRVATPERTLIDIVVRPQYAGSPTTLLNIYSSARPVLKVDRLIGHLKALDYRYPYHQTIGFLMQRAGFPEQDYGKLKNPGLRFDFYLSHRIESPRYDSEWKLYYPRDL